MLGPKEDMIGHSPVDWAAYPYSILGCDMSVKEVSFIHAGAAAAKNVLESFINERLKTYGELRNNPNIDTASHLSPYFNFGHLSPQSAVLAVKMAKRYPDSTDNFVEETVIRRELSDNFCFYNPNYDNLTGCYDWARATLNDHRHDIRVPLYTQQQLQEAQTYDDLWNAAQLQLVQVTFCIVFFYNNKCYYYTSSTVLLSPS